MKKISEFNAIAIVKFSIRREFNSQRSDAFMIIHSNITSIELSLAIISQITVVFTLLLYSTFKEIREKMDIFNSRNIMQNFRILY